MSELTVSNFNVQPTFNVKQKTNKNITSFNDNFKEQKDSSNAAYVWGTLAALAATGIAIVATKKIKANNFKKLLEQDKKLLDSLPIEDYPHKGKNVQETINNFLGKDSNITPHNYDLAKEYPVISVQRDSGGFHDLWITPRGFNDRRFPSQAGLPPQFAISSISREVKNNRLVQGGSSSSKALDKRAVVRFDVQDPKTSERPTNMRINVLSPTDTLTPVQQDLQKIMSSQDLSKEFTTYLDKMCQFRNIRKLREGSRVSREEIIKYFGYYEPADYDTILSVIQSLAKKGV